MRSIITKLFVIHVADTQAMRSIITKLFVIHVADTQAMRSIITKLFVIHVADTQAMRSIITKLYTAESIVFPFQQNVKILNFILEQALNAVMISKYFTDIFTTTNRKLQLCYFTFQEFFSETPQCQYTNIGTSFV